MKNLDVPKDNKDKRLTVSIPLNGLFTEGILRVPHNPRGIVLFAHGSGSSFKGGCQDWFCLKLV